MGYNNYNLPAHIAFSQTLPKSIKYNLSNSCAKTLTIGELCQWSGYQLDDLPLSYSSVAGSPELRRAIVDYMQCYTTAYRELEAEHIVTYCGAQEALSAIYHTLLQPGDEVIVCTPSYPSLVAMAEKLGARVKAIALRPEKEWQLTIDELAAQLSTRTKLIVINSPHNPTGSFVGQLLADDILALARQHNCYLLADDVAQASNYNALAIKHNYLEYEKSVSVGVMSKSLGLAGIRIGWLATTNTEWRQAMLAYKASSSICTSAVDEALALQALTVSAHIIETNNAIIRQNIRLFKQFVEQHNGLFSWSSPQAGLLSVVEYLGQEGVYVMSQQLARNYQTLVLPSELFGLEGNYFRLGLGQANFAEGLQQFSGYIADKTVTT